MSAVLTPAAAPAAEEPPDTGDRHRLTVTGGLAALSLDAMASVAYGPEAIVLVLALAGGAGLGFTIPVTLTIAGLLAVLTFSYRQVIAAFPEGGGAYGVAKTYLGRRAGLTAAASLIVDYVLNVAVSVAAGVAALTSAFPGLLPYTLWLCLAVLALVTAVNLKGIAHSARAFIAPTAVYVGAILLVIVAGLVRGGPRPSPSRPPMRRACRPSASCWCSRPSPTAAPRSPASRPSPTPSPPSESPASSAPRTPSSPSAHCWRSC
ncbi:amino acid permease [Streptosporangium roseum]|uniref:amino acid permease n=1 Tax=Streptosporangium roseum TaxID=2001 RepID=UPI0033173FB8